MGLWDGSGGCLCGRYGVLHEIILSLMGPYNHQPLNISGVLQVGDIVDPDPVPEDDDDDEEEEKPKPAKKPRKVYPPLLWASSLGVGGSVSWIWASWSAWMGSSFFFNGAFLHSSSALQSPSKKPVFVDEDEEEPPQPQQATSSRPPAAKPPAANPNPKKGHGSFMDKMKKSR